MKLIAIDIVGTIRELLKWALKEALLLLGMLMFGLSAPLLFTVGAETLVWQNPNDLSWGVAYFFLGPFACAIWMVFICHWQSIRRAQRAGNLANWREEHGGIVCTVGKSILFMVSGFFGSAIAEALSTRAERKKQLVEQKAEFERGNPKHRYVGCTRPTGESSVQF
jgi:hypothetical protein